MGSEMCIRDRVEAATATSNVVVPTAVLKKVGGVEALAGLKIPAVVATSVVKTGPSSIAPSAPASEQAAAAAAAAATAAAAAAAAAT